MLAQATGVQLVYVPYRGAAPAIADLVASQIPAILYPLDSLVPQAKAGKLRILAHSGSRRSSLAPDVPTFKELGYPALDASGWYCLIAPAGVCPEVIARYNEILNQASRTDSVRGRLRALNIEFREMTPAEIAVMMKAEYERWGQIVKATGFSAESQ